MARFRSKPVQTTYVEALLDEGTRTYFVQEVTREGKPKGKIEQIHVDDFHKTYEPVVRKPREKTDYVQPSPKK